MRHILARANRDVLRQFACSRVLLAFDYDGTLAPIVPSPERAAMRPETRALLRALSRRVPCVVITGRARDDAVRRMRGIGTVEVIGNHGIEPWQVSPRGLHVVRRWRGVLERQLAPFDGVTVEDKLYSLALHYRRSRQKKQARAAILRAAAAIGDVRLVRGKQVINLVPTGAPHKGVALERARARFACDTAIYVGDDDTDEDVFALDQPGRLLTIRVGQKRKSLASYFLRNQAEVDRLLEALLDGAPAPRQPAARGARR
jgi:trehalose 6-phosphate phosphatase